MIDDLLNNDLKIKWEKCVYLEVWEQKLILNEKFFPF